MKIKGFAHIGDPAQRTRISDGLVKKEFPARFMSARSPEATAQMI